MKIKTHSAISNIFHFCGIETENLMPNHSIGAVFCVELGNFFFAVYILLVVNFHATAGTAHGAVASAAKSICNNFFSFFFCGVFYQNTFQSIFH